MSRLPPTALPLLVPSSPVVPHPRPAPSAAPEGPGRVLSRGSHPEAARAERDSITIMSRRAPSVTRPGGRARTRATGAAAPKRPWNNQATPSRPAEARLPLPPGLPGIGACGAHTLKCTTGTIAGSVALSPPRGRHGTVITVTRFIQLLQTSKDFLSQKRKAGRKVMSFGHPPPEPGVQLLQSGVPHPRTPSSPIRALETRIHHSRGGGRGRSPRPGSASWSPTLAPPPRGGKRGVDPSPTPSDGTPTPPPPGRSSGPASRPPATHTGHQSDFRPVPFCAEGHP